MRKGQQIKTRQRCQVKPAGPGKEPDKTFETHPLTRYLNWHLEWMLVNNYSSATMRARRYALTRFIGWCAERNLTDPREITRPMLDRYKHYLFYYRREDGSHMTIGTQHGFLAPLKTFFKWLVRANHIPFSPASEMEMPRKGKQLPRSILSVEEVEMILAEAEPNNPQGLRDRAMLETLYSTGMRRMELPGLMVYDVDTVRRVVFVRQGKGKRDRVIPIGERAAAWVARYQLEARPLLVVSDHDTLFVTDYGEPITATFVANRVRRYKGFANITKPGGPHMFRHACATHMLEGGADIRFIQAMLGHVNLATTQVYTHVSIDKLKEIHAATHPARLARVPVPVAEVQAGDKNAANALLLALDAENEADAQGEPSGKKYTP